MGDSLAEMKVEPAEASARPATPEEIEELHRQLADWEVVTIGGIRRLRRTYAFRDFARALEFTARVGALADQEWHHPEIVTFHVENGGAEGWGRVTVT